MNCINEMYLVQIFGMWGLSPLLHTHGSSSYIKMMVIAQDTLQTGAQGSYSYIQQPTHFPRE